MDGVTALGAREDSSTGGPHLPNRGFESLCRAVSRAAAVVTVAGAAAVLAGWSFDVRFLRGEIAGLAPMKPMTAIEFALAALALALARRTERPFRRRCGSGLALLVGVVAALNLAQDATSLDLGLDRLVPASGLADMGGVHPGHMPIGASASFVLMAGAIAVGGGSLRRAGPAMVLVVVAISLVVLVGACYGVRPGAGSDSPPMSISTAALFQMLAAAALFARPGLEPVALLGQRGPGGALARRLVPAALLMLPLLGYLRLLAERAGLFGRDMGIAVMVLAASAILSAIVWRTAALLERADRARLAAEEAIATHREQLQAIFDNTTYVMFIKDLVGRYVLVNREFERVTGMTRERAIGKTVDDVVTPEEAERIWARERTAMSSGGPVTFETVTQRDDGAHAWLITTCPLRDARGALAGLCGIAQDITARRRTEDDLRFAKEKAERAAQELEAFAYSVSHDLRAPLRHVSGFVEMLETHAGPALDETGRRYTQRIAAAARRMGLLIDDLLSFSRMGRAEMRQAHVDLRALVGEVRRDLAPSTAGRRIAWLVGDLPVVVGDPAMLRVVLSNLLSNAVKYTGPRPEPRIEVLAESRDGEVRVSVRDNGVGFDPRYAAKLFGVFQRLHRQEDFEGTGIGLANVKRIVERHGGRTWAEAQVDRGATFYFSLPERPAREAAGGGEGRSEAWAA